MLSKWKHAIILIFCVLLVCGALANSQRCFYDWKGLRYESGC